ncbi:MAG: hypothetical protein LBP76_11730 [Treponema sp.]|nr:hypothetical protein [Treponema sp.]
MKTKKNILIVTDGMESTQKIAEKIAVQLSGNRVVLLTALDVAGTDVLPADAYFLGCEKRQPSSFAYLEELLRHINLVRRPCGIFSSQSKMAVKYLTSLVRDSEMALYPQPYFENEEADLSKWVEAVLG